MAMKYTVLFSVYSSIYSSYAHTEPEKNMYLSLIPGNPPLKLTYNSKCLVDNVLPTVFSPSFLSETNLNCFKSFWWGHLAQKRPKDFLGRIIPSSFQKRLIYSFLSPCFIRLSCCLSHLLSIKIPLPCPPLHPHPFCLSLCLVRWTLGADSGAHFTWINPLSLS